MTRNTTSDVAPSARTQVRRYDWLARYDRRTVEGILDATPLAHIGCLMAQESAGR